MKKIGFALMALFASCSTENESVEMLEQNVKQITFSIEDMIPEDMESRVFRDDKGQYLWEQNDSLGVFPNLGGQVGFGIEEKYVGTTDATFNGGGWALRNGYTYSAYSPYNFYNRNVKAVPMSYMGMVQDGNNSKSHLSSRIFMASKPVTVTNGELVFSMSSRGTMIELALTLPQAATYTSVDLYTSDEILPVEVTFDLQSDDLKQSNVKCSNHYTLKLENVKTTVENEVVTVWFITPAVVDQTKTFKAVVRDSQGYVYVADVKTSKNNIATVNNPPKSKRTLKASPVLTDGFTGGIEDWEKGVEISGVAE